MCACERGSVDKEHPLGELQRAGVDTAVAKPPHRFRIQRFDVCITCDSALRPPSVDRRIWLNSVIRGEPNDNARWIAHAKKRVQKRTEITVESKNLIVNLARVRTERVTHRIRRRERDGEEI